MAQTSAEEFERLPLRVHDFLAGVPLHDVWVVDLPRPRPGITLDEFLRAMDPHLVAPSAMVRALLKFRLFAGWILGWDREPASGAWEPFAGRLTPADRSKSLAAPGASQGAFRVVYRFQNEQLLEIINRTVHAAALAALIEATDRYRFYLAVYVRPVNRFTPIYMALIDPFRKRIVYPSLLRTAQSAWNQAFGPTTPRP